VAFTRARDSLLLPHFQMPTDCKFQNENLFAGPLLKALEEKGGITRSTPRPPAEAQDLTVPASLQTPVYWAEIKDGAKSLEDPPAWVVPLDAKYDEKALVAEKEKLKAQQQARKEKLEKLRGQKEFKSVTSVLKVDPDKQEKEEKVFEEPETTSPWGGKDLGSLAHLLMEKGWDWDEAKIKKGAQFYAERMGIPQEGAALAVGWVTKALRSDLIQRARISKNYFRELPVTGKQKDGTFINAVLDLAFLEDDQWVIVDYKTDQNMETRKEKYKEQLGYYGDLLTQFMGRKVKETFLYFMRNEKGAFKITP